MAPDERDGFVTELRTATARFLETEVSLDNLLAGERCSYRLWQQAAQMGWFRLVVPEEDAGFGLSIGQLGVVFAEVGKHLFPGPLLDHAVALPWVISAASPAQRERLVPALDGERVVALLDPATDAEPLRRCPGVQLNDGQLDGQVQLVRSAPVADELIVVARDRTDDAVFLVERDREGIEVEAVSSMDPTTDYHTVMLRAVPVGEADLIGRDGEVASLSELRASMRLMMAHELSGLTERMLQMSIEYAKVRHQFGRPIGSFQAIGHILADMFVRVDSLRNLCAASAEDVSRDAELLVRTSIVAKSYAAAVGRSVAEGALQVHGGIGFTMEHPLHLFLKRALALQGPYGDERELHRELGRTLLAVGR